MRRFELVDGSSAKFWEMTLSGLSFTVRYGRIGTKGQEKEKRFATEAEAAAASEKQIKSKLRKGYVELTEGGPETKVPAAVPMPATSGARTNPTPEAKSSTEALIVRNGIKAFTPAQQALLERGYPYMALLVDGHSDDEPKKVKRAAKKVANAIDPVYHVGWPRDVAGRFLRAFAQTGPDWDEALKQPGWPTELEVSDIVRAIVFPPWKDNAPWDIETNMWGRNCYAFEVAAVVYLLEAEFGIEKTLSAVMDTIEAYAAIESELAARVENPADRPSNYGATYLMIPTNMLLLRASPETRDAARKRLEAVAPLNQKSTFAVGGLQSLALGLYGKPAMEFSTYRWTPPDCWLFVEDDPGLVASVVGYTLDVRGVWLGGEEALKAYAKNAKQVKKGDLPHIIGDFGMIDHPQIADCMGLWAKKKGGEAAAAWLASSGSRAPGAAPEQNPEDAYDALTETFVEAMTIARGNTRKENAALRRAADRYMEIRAGHDGEPTEFIMHFFCADGVALERDRVPAWARLDPSEAESARWAGVIRKRVD